MGIIFSVATILIAFTLAMLGRFSSKEHPKANRVFLGTCVLNVLVGIGSLFTASQGQHKQVEMLAKLNSAQRQLLGKQEDQLRVGNELAGRLRQAQTTTERISTELTSNTKAVGTVLNETERALEPLGDLEFTCELTLPDEDPEVSNIKQFLSQSDHPQSPEKDFAESIRTLLVPPSRLGGWILPRNSPRFPKPTTALGALVDSAQVLLQFNRNHRSPKVYAQHTILPSADLMTDITPRLDLKLLMLTNPDRILVLSLMADVTHGKWGSTGAILSVKDLIRAQAVVQPIFHGAMIQDAKEREFFLRDWSHTSLRSLVMYTGDGRRWELDRHSSQIVRAEHDAPLYVGAFKPVKPNTTQ